MYICVYICKVYPYNKYTYIYSTYIYISCNYKNMSPETKDFRKSFIDILPVLTVQMGRVTMCKK